MFAITALHEMFPFKEIQKDSAYKMKQNFLCLSLASNEQIRFAQEGSRSAASGAETTTNTLLCKSLSERLLSGASSSLLIPVNPFHIKPKRKLKLRRSETQHALQILLR